MKVGLLIKRDNALFSTIKKMHGFSLIEGMVAVVIFSIGLMGLVILQTRSVQYMQAAQDRAVITVAANSYINELKAAISGNKDTSIVQAMAVAQTKLEKNYAARTSLHIEAPERGSGQYQVVPSLVAQNLSMAFVSLADRKVNELEQHSVSATTITTRPIVFNLYL